MANNIKGITIEIGGNTAPLDKALKDVNKTSRDLQSELREVNKQLKLDPTNTTLLEQKQKLLAESITNTKGKLDTLKQAEQQAQEQFKHGKISEEQYRSLQREVIKTEQNLNVLEKESKAVGNVFDEVNKKSSFFGKLKDKAKESAEQIKTAFGVVGITVAGYLKGAVDKATAAEQSTKRLSNLLQNQGMTATEAKKNIDSFTSAITKMSSFSGGEAKEALQVLTEKGISAGEALKLESTLANVAAGTGGTLAESADLVADAYHGKAKALVSLGILSKEEVKQLGDSEKATISMADVQDRLNKRFSGAAQADLQSYSGKLKENQNTINAAKSQIGTALLPVLAQVAELIAKIIAPIAQFIKENPKFTAALLSITAIFGTLIGGLSVFNTITTAMGTMGVAFKGIGVAAGGSILPMLGVIAVISLVAFAVYEIIKHWSQISGFFKKLWTDIKTETEKIWNGLKSFFTNTWNSITDTCTNIWNRIGDYFKNLWTSIKTTTVYIWNSIKAFFSNTWNSIINGIKSIVTSIVNFISDKFYWQIYFFQDIFTQIQSIFKNVWTIIKNIFLGAILLIIDLVTGNFTKLKEDAAIILNNLKNAILNIWQNIKQIFFDYGMAINLLLQDIWNGIINIAANLWNGFKDFISGLWNGIKDVTEVAWNGLKSTVINLCNSIIEGAVNIWNGLLNWFTELPGKLYNSAVNMFTKMKEGVVNTVTGVKDAVITGLNAAINWIKELPSEAVTWGKDMIDGIVKGIKDAAHAVGDAVNGVAQDIRKFLHFSVPDEGPLVDYESWMPDFMQGLAKGIEKSKHLVTNSIKSLSSDMSIGFKSNIIQSGEASSNNGSSKNITQNLTINSPIALSPSETARQNRRTLQELSLKF